jgi:prepilin-type N-terminal cleavage/methylation domain-containing protein
MPNTPTPHSHPHPHSHGFTLVEMAVVIVIMGLMAALILPGVFRTIERNKLERGRNAVTALKNEVVGYVIRHKELPDTLDQFSGRRDQWGQRINYWYAYPFLTDICVAEPVDGIELDGSITATGIAFVLVSNGKNMNTETGCDNGLNPCVPGPNPLIPEEGPATEVELFRLGDTTAVAGFEYDDIIEYVSLAELKGKACRTTESGKTPPGTPAAHLDFRDDNMDLDDTTKFSEYGGGAILTAFDDMQVLQLGGDDGTQQSYVRLADIIDSDTSELCEYTIMGWLRAHDDNTGSSTHTDPIINRQPTSGLPLNFRTFWIAIARVNPPTFHGPLRKLAGDGSSTNIYYWLDVGNDPGSNYFRDQKWHFFAVNMESTGTIIKDSNNRCAGGPYLCTLYGSLSNEVGAKSPWSQSQRPKVFRQPPVFTSH